MLDNFILTGPQYLLALRLLGHLRLRERAKINIWAVCSTCHVAVSIRAHDLLLTDASHPVFWRKHMCIPTTAQSS